MPTLSDFYIKNFYNIKPELNQRNLKKFQVITIISNSPVLINSHLSIKNMLNKILMCSKPHELYKWFKQVSNFHIKQKTT